MKGTPLQGECDRKIIHEYFSLIQSKWILEGTQESQPSSLQERGSQQLPPCGIWRELRPPAPDPLGADWLGGVLAEDTASGTVDPGCCFFPPDI